jgi:hypothetical protein
VLINLPFSIRSDRRWGLGDHENYCLSDLIGNRDSDHSSSVERKWNRDTVGSVRKQLSTTDDELFSNASLSLLSSLLFALVMPLSLQACAALFLPLFLSFSTPAPPPSPRGVCAARRAKDLQRQELFWRTGSKSHSRAVVQCSRRPGGGCTA